VEGEILKPVSQITKKALIDNVRDLRDGVHVPPVLHPSVTVSDLTLRYRELISELRRKLNGSSQKPQLKG
jgi:hypothetical protein